jgi:predicted pyridoxine 5'-phosphate oxidase superfamily flavin-nucleotide-binding protein
MFSKAARQLQEEHRSRAQYERLAQMGASQDALTAAEIDFIGRRDSFYLASVTEDGWPYVQHRGGPTGFLKVIDAKTLAFADYAGNKQYISTGNVATNDRIALFLMDYPHQARLKLIGHAMVVEPEDDPALLAKVKDKPAGVSGRVERIIVIKLTAFDWNCSQYITPRYTEAEIQAIMAAQGK